MMFLNVRGRAEKVRRPVEVWAFAVRLSLDWTPAFLGLFRTVMAWESADKHAFGMGKTYIYEAF